MMLNNKTLLSLPLDETAYEQKRGGIEFDPFLRVQMSSCCSLSFERISAHEGGESMSFAECALAMQTSIVVGKRFSSVATHNLFMYARFSLSALRVGLGSQF